MVGKKFVVIYQLLTKKNRSLKCTNLLVDVLGSGQVLVALDLSLDEMVAVDGGGHGDLGKPGRDELQHGHLRRRVLHRNTVCTKKKLV